MHNEGGHSSVSIWLNMLRPTKLDKESPLKLSLENVHFNYIPCYFLRLVAQDKLLDLVGGRPRNWHEDELSWYVVRRKLALAARA